MLADTSADTVDFENFAQFGQVELDLSDRVELALALRNDDDQTEVLSNSGDQREFSVQKLQPKVTLTYRPTPQASLYGSYGEGFRSGGLNPTSRPLPLTQTHPWWHQMALMRFQGSHFL
jgi:iron complex outermembrane receptor protein